MRLGADPEVFLQSTDGVPRSAIGYIGADKWNPMQIPDMPQGFTLQEDNVSLEYGIPPASSSEEFQHHIRAVMQKSLEFVPGLSFSNLSCIIFPDSEMENPLAHMFGCEPDFDAWALATNPKPQPPHPNMRSAGGHVHVETSLDPILVVRAMDVFLGVPSTLMDKGEDRKQLYGKRGAHRRKSYGVEYRTLSNFWIFEDRLVDWVWRNTQRALEAVAQGRRFEEDDELIRRAINDNDKEAAAFLVEKHQLEVL